MITTLSFTGASVHEQPLAFPVPAREPVASLPECEHSWKRKHGPDADGWLTRQCEKCSCQDLTLT